MGKTYISKIKLPMVCGGNMYFTVAILNFGICSKMEPKCMDGHVKINYAQEKQSDIKYK